NMMFRVHEITFDDPSMIVQNGWYWEKINDVNEEVRVDRLVGPFKTEDDATEAAAAYVHRAVDRDGIPGQLAVCGEEIPRVGADIWRLRRGWCWGLRGHHDVSGPRIHRVHTSHDSKDDRAEPYHASAPLAG